LPRSVLGIGALLTVLAVLLGARQLGGMRHPPVWSQTTASTDSTTASHLASTVTQLPIPACSDGTRLLAGEHPVAFVDPLHGWKQIGACTGGQFQTGLARTSDGGDTWQSLGSPSAVGQLRFVSLLDGWLLGPNPPLVTHDGGATWTEDAQLDGVVMIEAVDDSIWAARRHCQDIDCDYELLNSSNRGITWQPMAAQPPLQGGRVLPPMPGYRLQVARVGPRDAWVLSGGNEIPLAIFTTDDGGISWEALTLPCEGFAYFLAAADAAHVWLLCSNVAGAGSATKFLYVSSDGGAEWHLIGDSAPLAEPGVHNLPMMGYVRDFVAVSSQRAFIGHARGILIMTRNGGSTWTAPQLGPLGDGILQVVFVDEQHGWVALQDALWRTTDGGDTWERLALDR
jgi:photosystem II stability/assembly factor-like uncharacterized protein